MFEAATKEEEEEDAVSAVQLHFALGRIPFDPGQAILDVGMRSPGFKRWLQRRVEEARAEMLDVLD